jgi:hypothetical protein
MADNSFKIGNVDFKTKKLNAFQQFHICRKLAPILGDLLPMAGKFSKMTEAEIDKELADGKIEGLKPILDGLAKLSEEDTNKVLLGLLSAVEMKQEHGNWAPVANPTMILFNDLELPVLLQAAGRAFMYNMSGFFSVLPQVSPGRG